MGNNMRFFEKLKLLYDPAILLLGIYPGKTIIQKYTYMPMLTEVLSIIAKTWKQYKFPWIPMERGMEKEDVVHIYDRILISHKKSEVMPSATTLIDLEIII